MDKLLEFLNGFNVQTIISVAAVMWYFTKETKDYLKIEIEEMKSKLSIQSARSDRLYEMFIDLLKHK